MGKKMMTENEVKKKLGVDSFKDFNKEQISEFASQLPYMDRDLAIKIIDQFPDFSNMALGAINQFRLILGKLTDDAAQGQKAVIASYNKILDELVDLLKKEDVFHEERVQILERMLYVADRIAEHDKEQKRFLKEWFQFQCIPL